MMDLEKEAQQLSSWRWDRNIRNDDYSEMISALCARVRDEALEEAAKTAEEAELDEHHWSKELSNGWRVLKARTAELIRALRSSGGEKGKVK